MKNVKMILILAVMAGTVVVFSQRRASLASAPMPVTPVEAAEATPADAEPAIPVAVVAAPPRDAFAAPASPAPTFAPDALASIGEAATNDVELAYQLGEDISALTPEARARLRADWEARVRSGE